MTDVTKYKSVAVKLPIWQKLKKLGADDFRSVGKVIEFLCNKEFDNRKTKWVYAHNAIAQNIKGCRAYGVSGYILRRKKKWQKTKQLKFY